MSESSAEGAPVVERGQPEEMSGFREVWKSLEPLVAQLGGKTYSADGDGMSGQRLKDLFGVARMQALIDSAQGYDNSPIKIVEKGWERTIYDLSPHFLRLHIKPERQQDFGDLMINFSRTGNKTILAIDSGLTDIPLRRFQLTFSDTDSFTAKIYAGEKVRDITGGISSTKTGARWSVRETVGKRG